MPTGSSPLVDLLRRGVIYFRQFPPPQAYYSRRDATNPGATALDSPQLEKREVWESDFNGTMALQDGRAYWAGATLRTTWNGEQCLFIHLRPKVQTLRGCTRAWWP